MFEKITAKIISSENKSIVLSFYNLELRLFANHLNFSVGLVPVEVFTYLVWNSETGPALFGFCSEIERQAFKILIDCPKIGPVLSMNILTQIPAKDLFLLIFQEDESALSKINGIGPKSAKNMISFLKEKAAQFLRKNIIVGIDSSENGKAFLLDVKEALSSLGYSSQEINSVILELSKDKNITSFDQALRQAFSFFQKN
jgi:Holliday junction DNA helicase RuvA